MNLATITKRISELEAQASANMTLSCDGFRTNNCSS